MIEYTNNINYWKKIRDKKKDASLTFIHTPKCAGSYVNCVLNNLNIKNKKHKQANIDDGITFTVIRNPIDRFESLLNYRLQETKPRIDWPKSLNYIYNNKSMNLNQIISKMTDKEITNFIPFYTLSYWSKNIDIFITINKLPEFLSFFGYKIQNNIEKKNVSKKNRGRFNKLTKNRISKLYKDDMILFRKVIFNK